MATKEAKPNGQYFLEEHVEEYFQNILISDLPGVGYSTTTKLNQLNWKTCYDLQQLTLVRIQQELGKKLGETLNNYCRGIDNKPLTYDQVRAKHSACIDRTRYMRTIYILTDQKVGVSRSELWHSFHPRSRIEHISASTVYRSS